MKKEQLMKVKQANNTPIFHYLLIHPLFSNYNILKKQTKPNTRFYLVYFATPLPFL
jgi:hypothetical protein